MSADNSISVSDLVVDHQTVDGTIRALDCHGLVVDGGTSVAVTGPSGCGKSTLLGVLAGLALPTRGTVTIGDIEITALGERVRVAFRRSTFGVVYQADNLLPFLTVAENILLQLRLTGEGPGAREAFDRTDALLARLGIAELRDRLPDELSGGQRQRVAVARAVVHRPRVILADEPTGALDEANARGVIELLVELHRALGATLVLVTHAAEVAGRMQRIVRLRDGAVLDHGEAVNAR